MNQYTAINLSPIKKTDLPAPPPAQQKKQKKQKTNKLHTKKKGNERERRKPKECEVKEGQEEETSPLHQHCQT